MFATVRHNRAEACTNSIKEVEQTEGNYIQKYADFHLPVRNAYTVLFRP
jgi:hypothetical protein